MQQTLLPSPPLYVAAFRCLFLYAFPQKKERKATANGTRKRSYDDRFNFMQEWKISLKMQKEAEKVIKAFEKLSRIFPHSSFFF